MQCNLAKTYELELKEGGLDGFPLKIRDRGSTVRLRGAVLFAQLGIDEVWFYLLPHRTPEEIESLEKALVPVGVEFNRRRGYPELLNVQLKRGAAGSGA